MNVLVTLLKRLCRKDIMNCDKCSCSKTVKDGTIPSTMLTCTCGNRFAPEWAKDVELPKPVGFYSRCATLNTAYEKHILSFIQKHTHPTGSAYFWNDVGDHRDRDRFCSRTVFNSLSAMLNNSGIPTQKGSLGEGASFEIGGTVYDVFSVHDEEIDNMIALTDEIKAMLRTASVNDKLRSKHNRVMMFEVMRSVLKGMR